MTIPMLARTLSLVALAGCFGSGSPPIAASEATSVLDIVAQPQQCNGLWKYIGDVAIAPGSGGYAVELPWEGPDCNNNGNSGQLPFTPVPVLQFGTPGASALGASVGSAGQAQGASRPNVVVDGATGTTAWAYSNSTGNGGNQGGPDIDVFVLEPGNPPTTQGPQGLGLTNAGGGGYDVAGMVIDDTAMWVAVSDEMNNNGLDLDNPTFPSGPSVQVGPGGLWRVGYGSGGLQPSELTSALSFPSGIPEPLRHNSTTLFYVATAQAPAIAELGAFPKTGTTDADRIHLATLDTSVAPDVGPVGLAADDQHVAWAASIDETLDIQSNQHGCWIWSLDLTQPLGSVQPQPLFTSTTLSCMSLAMDATSVYFTIVHVDPDSRAMRGDGIGRVSLADGTFESIALGMTGEYAGPRRVYLDNVDDAIYAVDPMVIGKLAKAALDGQHDFSPGP